MNKPPNLDELSKQPEWNIVSNLIKTKLGVEIIDVDENYLHVKGIFRENAMVKLPHWLVSEILRSWQ